MQGNPLLLELPPEASSVRTARAAVSQFAARCGVHAADVALCVSEAVTNAVVHAFRDREGRSGTIRVLAECTDGRMLRVSVEDDGVGVSPRSDSPGLGLGLGADQDPDVEHGHQRHGQGLAHLHALRGRLLVPASDAAQGPLGPARSRCFSRVLGVALGGACSGQGARAIRFEGQPPVEAGQHEQPLDGPGWADEHHADPIAGQLLIGAQQHPQCGGVDEGDVRRGRG